jgi:hypothetical protein
MMSRMNRHREVPVIAVKSPEPAVLAATPGRPGAARS